jgi:hypothetical protein
MTAWPPNENRLEIAPIQSGFLLGSVAGRRDGHGVVVGGLPSRGSMLRKTLLVLANSRKLSGRCVAGRAVAGARIGEWIRPVSDRPDEEVNFFERRYEDDSDPRLLDLASVPLIEPRPKGCHSENWLLDANRWWKREGRVGWAALASLSEGDGPLWANGFSTRHGCNDRIPEDQAARLPGSLRLVRISRLRLSVLAPGTDFGDHRRRVQGFFQLGGFDYGIRVTDPDVERDYLRRRDGNYFLGECFLTLSIGEPFKGFRYKLIAAVIERARTP